MIKISVAMKVIKLISLNIPDRGTYMSVHRLSKLRTFGKDFVVKSGLFMQNPDLGPKIWTLLATLGVQ